MNDPLIGFLTDRTFPFTRKTGKRFPWIVAGIIPASFVFILLFNPPTIDPSVNPWPTFGWIVFSTCLFDSLTSLCFVNVSGLFPDKFQTDEARRKAQGIQISLGMIAMPISFTIPPLFIKFGERSTYLNMAIACALLLFVVALFTLPGMRENEVIIERYYVSKEKSEGFISALKSSLKQSNFLGYIAISFGFQVVTQSLTGSIAYSVNFILRSSEYFLIVLFASFLTGDIISIPFWLALAKRLKNNRKSIIIGAISLIIATFIITFHYDELSSIIFNFILGFAMGNLWTLLGLIFADVMDERMVITKKDQRGATVGMGTFFSRLARGVQVATFAIVHQLTGFIEGATSYEELAALSPTPELALLGIRLHMGVIPCINYLFVH
ncbi:MAG: MFS transporter [Promethearchaeota archaeon]